MPNIRWCVHDIERRGQRAYLSGILKGEIGSGDLISTQTRRGGACESHDAWREGGMRE